jgi:hypothetical protein
MNRKMIMLALICSLAVTALSGQDRRRRPLPTEDEIERRDEARKEQREAMRERIEGLRKVKLMDLLELEGAQVEQFFSVYNPLQKAVYQAKAAVDAAVSDLVDADRAKADDATLAAKAALVLERQHALVQAVEARERGVKAVLSVRQHARYVGFEAGFMDELQRMILRRLKR